jgi:hypothetical protein
MIGTQENCPLCGAYLPGAIAQLGTVTTGRVCCVPCWERLCAKSRTSDREHFKNSTGTDEQEPIGDKG